MPTAKEMYTFEQFLVSVSPDDLPFVLETDEALKERGYRTKVELAKSGYVVSYQHPKTKKVLLNYVFRKSGMFVRLYGDHFTRYLDVIESLPESMLTEIGSQPNCKRMLNPAACNSRCPMGYAFTVGGTLYQKCRYGCFLFAANMDSLPMLRTLIEKEAEARDAA